MSHGHHHHAGTSGAGHARALLLVLGLTAGYTVVEVVGGLLTGSLALLADAGHMLSDCTSIGLALGAVWLAGRPATPSRSFGLKRAEILAALANGLLLVGVAVWIIVEAVRRLGDPPDVLGGWMLLVAGIGLVVNLQAAAIRWLLLDAAAPLAGAIVGSSLSISEYWLGALLAVYAGFFLFMGGTDLLPHAHEHPSGRRVLLTLAGFAGVLALSLVAR